MDELDTEKLRAVIAKATPGEWESESSFAVILKGSGAYVGYPAMQGVIASLYDGEYIENRNAEQDAAYIAAFDPPTTTALLDTIDTQAATIAKLGAHLQDAIEHIEKGDLDERMCCNGYMCGCRGSSKADEFLHFAREAVASALATEASHD